MIYKTTWYPIDGADPTETEFDSLADVAAEIAAHPEWEHTARGFYVDWVDDTPAE